MQEKTNITKHLEIFRKPHKTAFWNNYSAYLTGVSVAECTGWFDSNKPSLSFQLRKIQNVKENNYGKNES